MNQPAAEIFWPAAFDLSTRSIRVHNQLAMAIPAAQVWAWLIRAPLWPIWYPNSKNVRIVQGDPTDLGQGSQFLWSTFGVGIKSEVQKFELGKQIGWDARGLGVYAYHAWLIRRLPRDHRRETTWLVGAPSSRLGAAANVLRSPDVARKTPQLRRGWATVNREPGSAGHP